MPQAGFHGMLGAATRKWMPKREWLLLGMVFGNMFPDLDNIAVAVATVTKQSTEGLHRTFTHSLFTIVAVIALFYLIAALTKNPKWNNFGLGTGLGILMHILLDLVAWFNGVELLWPIRYELNFWSWFVMPEWLDKFLMTGEFLAFGLFFAFLASIARKQKTDADYEPKLRGYANVQFALFVLFTVLAFTMKSGFMTVYGALYLLALVFAIVITFRMRRTIEAV